jgi:hypothetical protein
MHGFSQVKAQSRQDCIGSVPFPAGQMMSLMFFQSFIHAFIDIETFAQQECIGYVMQVYRELL